MLEINHSSGAGQPVPFNVTAPVETLTTIASSGSKTLTISMADFVANPGTYVKAFEAITERPIRLQFV